MSAKRCEPKPTKMATPVARLPVIHHKGAPRTMVMSSKASKECSALRWPKRRLSSFETLPSLITQPALGVVCIGEHGGCGHGKDLRDLVSNVKDG
jgi:hypothetical protein